MTQKGPKCFIRHPPAVVGLQNDFLLYRFDMIEHVVCYLNDICFVVIRMGSAIPLPWEWYSTPYQPPCVTYWPHYRTQDLYDFGRHAESSAGDRTTHCQTSSDSPKLGWPTASPSTHTIPETF